MNTIFTRFFASFILLLIPVVCFATETPGDAVAAFLNAVIFPVLSAFLFGMVGIILNKVRQKYNVQVSQGTQEYLETVARQGVAKAEEIAAAYAKRVTNEKMTGRDKLSMAVSHVLAAAPKVTPEQAEAIVHATLAKIHGVGATNDRTIQ